MNNTERKNIDEVFFAIQRIENLMNFMYGIHVFWNEKQGFQINFPFFFASVKNTKSAQTVD